MARNEDGESGGAPSFLTGQKAAAGTSGTRILANLEGRSPAPKKKSKAVVAAVLLLLAAGIGVALWANGSAVVQDTPLFASTDTSASAPVVADIPSPVSSSPEPAAPQAESEPLRTATIVNETHEPLQGSVAPADRPYTPDPLALLVEQRERAAATKSSAPRKSAESDHAKERAKPAARKPPVSDGDATLLAALMSHGLPAPKHSRDKNSSDAAKPAAVPAAAGAGPSLAMFAVPDIPLDQRIRQCREQGLIAGERCRLQVCAGQWGLVPECPVARPNVEP